MAALAQISDVLWNYCDLKCLYLENYYPNYDFVVLIFSHKDSITPTNTLGDQKIAACYIK